MHLKSLELSGFKSFAKKAILNFSSPITGIVGPNGSGKSNTAEAFRFVLGEQSIKSLRGKRGEDMIWNGGGDGASATSRANRASVKLVFDNTRRMFSNIDFDEVSIERIVHRDNSNEYMLNGTQVRLKDITELLANAHIGATGHHIISQGEADRILSANIRERREMIEDALGLKVYQWKKLESIRKLERTEENMERVESLRREIAPHLRFLKKQVEKVEKAEVMRRELVALYKVYFAYEEWYIETERNRLERELIAPRQEATQLEQALNRAKEILTASKNKDTTSDELIGLEHELAQTRTSTDVVARELGRIEGEIAVNQRAKQKEEARMKQEELKTVYVRDVEGVVQQIEQNESRFTIRDVLQLLRNFINSHRSSMDSQFLSDIDKELTRLFDEKKKHEQKREELQRQEVVLTEQYARLKQKIEHEKDTNRDAEKEVFRIIARQNEVRHVIGNLATELDRILHAETEFKRELGEAGMSQGREAVTYDKLSSQHTIVEGIPLTVTGVFAAQNDRRHQIDKLKIRLEDMGAGAGAEVLKEYRETEERDAFLARELEDLKRAKEELQKLIADLDMRIDVEFKQGILKINKEFSNYFALMFGGGHAELSVVKETRKKRKSDHEELNELLHDDTPQDIEGENEESGPEGLEVSVSLPRKKVKGLMMLSGGERALTSIALLFAISQVNPPPFIILDETDAALDEANSKKYGDMIENLSKHSQLILITHNRETMSRAGVLYGVTMGADGASKLLSIAFDEAVKVAK